MSEIITFKNCCRNSRSRTKPTTTCDPMPRPRNWSPRSKTGPRPKTGLTGLRILEAKAVAWPRRLHHCIFIKTYTTAQFQSLLYSIFVISVLSHNNGNSLTGLLIENVKPILILTHWSPYHNKCFKKHYNDDDKDDDDGNTV